jgi:hypothetical protein
MSLSEEGSSVSSIAFGVGNRSTIFLKGAVEEKAKKPHAHHR